MSASIDKRRRKLLSLQAEVRAGVFRLSRANSIRIATSIGNLVSAVFSADWSAAALVCTALLRLIQLQITAERLIARVTSAGGGTNGSRH